MNEIDKLNHDINAMRDNIVHMLHLKWNIEVRVVALLIVLASGHAAVTTKVSDDFTVASEQFAVWCDDESIVLFASSP